MSKRQKQIIGVLLCLPFIVLAIGVGVVFHGWVWTLIAIGCLACFVAFMAGSVMLCISFD